MSEWDLIEADLLGDLCIHSEVAFPPAGEGDVAADAVVFWNRRIVVVELEKLRITVGIGGSVKVHRFHRLEQDRVGAVKIVGGPARASRV